MRAGVLALAASGFVVAGVAPGAARTLGAAAGAAAEARQGGVAFPGGLPKPGTRKPKPTGATTTPPEVLELECSINVSVAAGVEADPIPYPPPPAKPLYNRIHVECNRDEPITKLSLSFNRSFVTEVRFEERGPPAEECKIRPRRERPRYPTDKYDVRHVGDDVECVFWPVVDGPVDLVLEPPLIKGKLTFTATITTRERWVTCEVTAKWADTGKEYIGSTFRCSPWHWNKSWWYDIDDDVVYEGTGRGDWRELTFTLNLHGDYRPTWPVRIIVQGREFPGWRPNTTADERDFDERSYPKLKSHTLVIRPGQKQASLTLRVRPDEVPERDEKLILRSQLASSEYHLVHPPPLDPLNWPITARGEIIDDDRFNLLEADRIKHYVRDATNALLAANKIVRSMEGATYEARWRMRWEAQIRYGRARSDLWLARDTLDGYAREKPWLRPSLQPIATLLKRSYVLAQSAEKALDKPGWERAGFDKRADAIAELGGKAIHWNADAAELLDDLLALDKKDDTDRY